MAFSSLIKGGTRGERQDPFTESPFTEAVPIYPVCQGGHPGHTQRNQRILGTPSSIREQDQDPTTSSLLSGDAKWLQERNAWPHFLSVSLCPQIRESCFLSPLVPSSARSSTGAPSKPSFEMPAVYTQPHPCSPRQPSTLSRIRMTVVTQ